MLEDNIVLNDFFKKIGASFFFNPCCFCLFTLNFVSNSDHTWFLQCLSGRDCCREEIFVLLFSVSNFLSVFCIVHTCFIEENFVPFKISYCNFSLARQHWIKPRTKNICFGLRSCEPFHGECKRAHSSRRNCWNKSVFNV